MARAPTTAAALLARFDPDWLDLMYNNRRRVPEHGEYFARWAAASQQARTPQAVLGQRFGPGPQETLDVFPASSGRVPAGDLAPVLVFIHGGYWRSLDKSDHSFVAPVFNRQGVCVVVPNYDLCPAVTVPDIVLQMVRALAWTWRHIAQWGGDPTRIMLVGHSAGGQLAAQLLNTRWSQVGADLPADLVRHALSVSGLFDLEPLMHTPSLSEALRLTPEQVARVSPAWQPAPQAGTLCAVAGSDESSEFMRHNRLIRRAWGRRVVPVCEALPGLNHFSVLDALVQPGHRLHQLALAGLQRRA